MPTTPTPVRRLPGSLSLVLSVLALLVALSGTAYAALANGSVHTKHLADGAVTTPKIAKNAVTRAKIPDGALSLGKFGGKETDRQTTVPNPIPVPINQCRSIFLALYNPAPPGVFGSMVIGTITTSTGGAVVSNSGWVQPTLVTETSQGGAIPQLAVCAGGSSETIPAGSIVTWSLIRP